MKLPFAALVWLSSVATLAGVAGAAEADAKASPESRASAFLSIEVPKWSRQNACYSCHNNGDAVRALACAASVGLLKDPRSVADSLRFLSQPDKWDANGPEGPFNDKKLARLQFAAAQAEAFAAGWLTDRAALDRGAEQLHELQQADGSWPTDAEGSIGSPITYGPALATALAVRTLRTVEGSRRASAIAKGRAWLITHVPHSVLAASATLWGLGSEDSQAASEQRVRCLKLIRQGEGEHGGWGPFVNSPPEVFDTALTVLALSSLPDRKEWEPYLTRARAYLIAQQESDGGWPATTRPPGVDSYSQRISTSAWALQALLVTREIDAKPATR